MLVGIHVDPNRGFNKVLERYEEILDFNEIKHIRLDINKTEFWSEVKKLDLFIFHYVGTEREHLIAKTIIPIIENELGIPCFPGSNANWVYDDKIREYLLLEQSNFNVIPTWIFWNKKDALDWFKRAELPLVFKLSGGASSENVVLVKAKRYGKKLIRKMFGKGIGSGKIPGFDIAKLSKYFDKSHIRMLGGQVKRILKREQGNLYGQRHRNYVFFQKFLPANDVDTRIHIIGNRAFSLLRHVRKNDFRASGFGLLEYDPEKVDKRCISIAFEIAKKLKFRSMAIDFLFDEKNQPLVLEMSYTRPDWGLWRSPGYWDDKMNWHEGHYWPQYLVLMDLLKIPNLKQPEMISDDGHQRIVKS